MTVREFLLYVGELRGCSKKELLQRLPSVLDLCQISDREHQLISQLSLGYKKRVGIAQAIIHSPELVILDEPISGLDPLQIVEMRSVIRNLSKEATILLSSHNLNEVAETCDRLLVLHQGTIIASGSTEELSGSIQSQHSVLCECRITSAQYKRLTETYPDWSISAYNDSNSIQEVEIHSSLTNPELIQILVAENIEVHSIQSSKSALEKVFLSLTTEKAV